MLVALLRAAYAADGAECLKGILAAISTLATQHGLNSKEKILLYKLIGDLAPKYDDNCFEEIWLNLGVIASTVADAALNKGSSGKM